MKTEAALVSRSKSLHLSNYCPSAVQIMLLHKAYVVHIYLPVFICVLHVYVLHMYIMYMCVICSMYVLHYVVGLQCVPTTHHWIIN